MYLLTSCTELRSYTTVKINFEPGAEENSRFSFLPVLASHLEFRKIPPNKYTFSTIKVWNGHSATMFLLKYTNK